MLICVLPSQSATSASLCTYAYICVLILLYTVYYKLNVSSYYDFGPSLHALLYMCPHTTINYYILLY